MAGYIVGRIQTEPLVQGSYNLVQLISMFFKVGGQSSRSYCHVVGKIQTEPKAPGSYNLVQYIDYHDIKRKMPIVIQGQRSRS